MRVHVKIIPPPIPAGSPLTVHEERPAQLFNTLIDHELTFQDAWNTFQQQMGGLYNEKLPRNWEIKKLQDRDGYDIDRRTNIREFFKEDKPDDRIVRVIMMASDRECSIAQGSFLRPEWVHARALSTPERERIKRRKTQEERYGAVVEELLPEMPVLSREEEDVAPEKPAEDEEQEDEREKSADADGFKIPEKVSKARKRRRSDSNRDEAHRVLVKDSQGKIGALLAN